MTAKRLNILWVSPLPASPPRFGAQARLHGLMSKVARNHDLSAVSLAEPGLDAAECERAMREYCRDVTILPNTRAQGGAFKRMLQLRSLASVQSYERFSLETDRLSEVLEQKLASERFDIVQLEFPYLAHLNLRKAPPGERPPALVLDTHEIAYDLARQLARRGSALRRMYGELNWRKLCREERGAFRDADGLCACSVADEERLLKDAPAARTVVVPNAADVDYYQPSPEYPKPDGRTVVFIGYLTTVPNTDGVQFLVRDIWPRIAAKRPDARLKIIGGGASPALKQLAGPGIEFTGFVDDLRPHMASAAAILVPLRLGGGTRLKIVEGMAMGQPIVSTSLGAEGIDAVHERELLIADDPARFADETLRLLDDAEFGKRIGQSARRLAVERYSWTAAAESLERFYGELLAARDREPGPRSHVQSAAPA